MNKTEIIRGLGLLSGVLTAVGSAVAEASVPNIAGAAVATLGLVAAGVALAKFPKANAAVSEVQAAVPVVDTAAPLVLPIVESAIKAAPKAP